MCLCPSSASLRSLPWQPLYFYRDPAVLMGTLNNSFCCQETSVPLRQAHCKQTLHSRWLLDSDHPYSLRHLLSDMSASSDLTGVTTECQLCTVHGAERLTVTVCLQSVRWGRQTHKQHTPTTCSPQPPGQRSQHSCYSMGTYCIQLCSHGGYCVLVTPGHHH